MNDKRTDVSRDGHHYSLFSNRSQGSPQMTTLANALSFEIKTNEKISSADLAYFENRFRNRLYDTVIEEFEKAKKEKNLTQAALARRLGKRPEQINRWFATPGNWTIETISHLLLGISGSELFFEVRSVCSPSGMTIEGTTASFRQVSSVSSIGPVISQTTYLPVARYAQPLASTVHTQEASRDED